MNATTGGLMDISQILKIIRGLNFKALEFAGKTFHHYMDDIERESLSRILTETEGNISAAARYLGISRTTLVMKIKRLNLQCPKITEEV
jgi:transcriptional regulator of acetoin/glycerol metabolism